MISISLPAPRRSSPLASLCSTAVLLAALVCTAGVFAQAKPPVPAKPPAPAPDVLLFTNGDQLSGKLLRGIGNSVVFKSDMAGEVTVPLDKVKELKSSGTFVVLRKGHPITQKPAPSGQLAYSDKKVALTASTAAGIAPAELIPPDQVAFIIDQATYERNLARKAGPLTGWNGSLSGGATLVRSTSNGSTFTTGVALVRAIPTVPFLPARNRTAFDLSETYGKLTQPVIPQTTPPTAPSIAITSIFHADAERDEYFSPRFYALADTSFDHNYSQGLNLQQVYGAGLGWTPIKKATRQLDVKADIHYESQQFQTPASNQDLIGSTIGESFRQNLPRKLLFTETLTVLPAYNNSNAYSANASAALALPLIKRLGVTLTTTDNFINNPAAGYNKNSFQFVTAISYTLH